MTKDHTLFLDKQFNRAIIGHFSRCGKPTVVVYDAEKVIDTMVTKDGMTREDAEEFFQFNMEGAWCGEGTPAFLYRGKRRLIEEIVSN